MENSQFKVAIIYNQKKKATEEEPQDLYAEFDDESVPLAIKDALLVNNFKIDILEADKTLYSNLEKGNYDFAFNIAEGLYGESRESQVPAMLEWLRIPYTGSGIFTMALSLDKRRTKETLLFNKLATPKSQLFKSLEDTLNPDLEFPLIVKPNSEGSSKGIDDKSIVYGKEELYQNVKKIKEIYQDNALVEEFLPGREFTVALIGNNEEIYKIPAVEIFVEKYENSKGIYTYEQKYVKEKEENSGMANLSPELKEEIYNLAIKSFKALDCKDFGRVDIRCNANGKPEVLEINPIPGLNPSEGEDFSYFSKACRLGNIGYTTMINSIFMFALERYGLESKMNSGIRNNVLKTLNKSNKMCK